MHQSKLFVCENIFDVKYDSDSEAGSPPVLILQYRGHGGKGAKCCHFS